MRLVLAALLAFACGEPGASGPGDDSALTVLFIGNSLTESNDLPALTRRIAQAGGRSLRYEVLLAPNTSLEDHWSAGAGERIAQVRANVVILQQGPSSLPESQEHLRTWAERFAPVIRDAGGTPALLMVWPDATRPSAFDAVATSYRAAAQAVDGLLIPAGDAWRAVWARDPDAPLYGPDGFHPSPLGSLVAALAVYAVLFDADVRALPSDVAPGIPAATVSVVLDAVAETVSAGSGLPEGNPSTSRAR